MNSRPKKWRYADDEKKLPENLWRVADFAKWLGVGVYNVYDHLEAGNINPMCYRRWGRIILFIPWRCAELIEDDRIFIKKVKY
jgi:hypothetical protein